MGKNYLILPRLMVNNGSIIVYYYHQTICRYPTGISISTKKDKHSKFVEWDYKNNNVKSSVEEFSTKSKKLTEIFNSVKEIIESKFTNEDIVLTGKELTKLLSSNYKVNQLMKSSLIREHYDKFFEIKRKTFSRKPQSLKDYTSLKNLLESYEFYFDKMILFRDFNDFFLEELTSFMEMKHPETLERNGVIFKFKTKGGLVKDTIRKRYDCLREFKDYLVKIKMISDSDFIEIKRSQIKPSDKKKVTLTIEEVHTLYKFNFENESLNDTRDLFVFICFMGLRWSDITQFDSRFIRKNGDDWIYEFTPIKTEDSSSIECFIPICSIVKEILLKNNLDLTPIIKSNKDFNEKLKIVGKKSGLFNTITRTKDKETGTYMTRYELLTAHKGRDTFITNLIDTTPINELMKYTGHTKVSTLMKYVDKSRQVTNKYVKIFDL